MPEDATNIQKRLHALGQSLVQRATQATAGHAICHGRWGDLDAFGWRTSADVGAFILTCQRPGVAQPLAIYALAPWQPLFCTSDLRSLPAGLLTVTDDAIVLVPPAGDPSPEATRLRDPIDRVIADLLSLKQNQAVLGKTLDAAPPPGLTILSVRVRRHYVTLEVAVPGSQIPLPQELARALSHGRVLELFLVPKEGPRQHMLLPPRWHGQADDADAAPATPRSPEAPATTPATAPATAQPRSKAPITLVPSGRGGPPSPFGHYHPKRTPDTVTDYRSSLGPKVRALPPSQASNLPELIRLLETQRRHARAHPGGWVPGNVILGADRREYRPSDEELLESEIGDRVARAAASVPVARVTEILRHAHLHPQTLRYRAISIRHVDVMGSGRFFYASAPVERQVVLGKP